MKNKNIKVISFVLIRGLLINIFKTQIKNESIYKYNTGK